MLNKRSIIIVIAVAVIGIGVLNLLRTPPGSGSTSSPVAGLAGGKSAASANELQGVFATLSNEVVSVAQIKAPALQPLSAWVTSHAALLSSTALWKRLNLTQLLQLEFEKAFRQSRAMAGNPNVNREIEDLYRGVGALQHALGDLEEVVAAASSRGFQATSQVELPQSMVHFAFKSAASVAAVKDFVQTKVLDNKPQLDGEAFSVVTAHDGFKLRFTFEPGTTVPARLILAEKEVTFLFGTTEPTTFAATEAAARLTESSAWKELQPQLKVNNPAIFAFVDPPKMSRYFDSIAAAGLDGQGTSASAAFSRGWSDIRAFAFAGEALNSIRSVSCALPNPDSKYAKLAASIANDRSGAASHSEFESLITTSSILAVRSTLASLPESLEFIRAQIEDLTKTANAPQTSSTEPLLKAVIGYVESTGLKEAGLLINSASGMPFPEGGIVLTGATVKGEQLLSETEKLLKLFLGSDVSISRTKGSDGRALLSIPGGPSGLPIVAGVAAENALVISLNESYIGQAEAALRQKASGFAAFTPSPVIASLPHSSLYFYLNSTQAFSMVRGYLPMMLAFASQGGGPAPELAEVEELLDLLSGTFVSSQRDYAPSASVVCTEKIAGVVQPRDGAVK